MKTLFDVTDRAAIEARLQALQTSNVRQWGKMNQAQAIAHCAGALEMATGDRRKKQKLLGKLLSPFVRSAFLSEKPFGKNGPTDPDLVVSDERDLAAERARLIRLLEKFCQAGPNAAGQHEHVFFGKLTGDQWGVLMHKHIDHHLRQFGA